MANATGPAPSPKKRSLFKRAAWQDAPQQDEDDLFSHSNEFKKIAAEQHRRDEEKRRVAEEERRRRQDEQRNRKRRKVSIDHEPALPRTSSKARSRTPLSPAPPQAPPDSLSARYDTLTKPKAPRNEPVVIDLGGSDDDDDDALAYNPRSFRDHSPTDCTSRKEDGKHGITIRPHKSAPVEDDDDDGLGEVRDPALAALAARARARAANSAQAAAPTSNGAPVKVPIAQLFVSPQIPETKPLMVKVRIDSTLERTRLAWCGKQGYSEDMTKCIFFTWKGTRVYDSTTVRRLGIVVEANGNVSVEGDPNIYDDITLPKVYVEAWTEHLYLQRKKEDAAAAAAKKKAAEPSPDLEERDPTPEPAPKATKIRLIMKAKGKEDFKISVNPDTTVGHIAHAYKTQRGIDETQPITLMFDGQRLPPMDTIDDAEIEDLDSIDVVFK